MMKSEQEKKLNAWIVDEVCVQLTPTSRPSDAETIAQKILSKWDSDGKSPELVEALATAHLIKVSLIVGQEVYNWPRPIREDNRWRTSRRDSADSENHHEERTRRDAHRPGPTRGRGEMEHLTEQGMVPVL